MSLLFISLLIIVLFTVCTSVSNPGFCPNRCNGHGFCNVHTDVKCICFPTYTGADCSQRYCPSGTAWFDFPHANNTAHATKTECSNMVIYSNPQPFRLTDNIRNRVYVIEVLEFVAVVTASAVQPAIKVSIFHIRILRCMNCICYSTMSVHINIRSFRNLFK